MKSYSDSYRESGVDITAGYKAVELMKKHIARTASPAVSFRHRGIRRAFCSRPDRHKTHRCSSAVPTA